jgi:hypothetical protein
MPIKDVATYAAGGTAAAAAAAMLTVAPANAADKWAAIAYSPADEVYGWANNADSEHDAHSRVGILLRPKRWHRMPARSLDSEWLRRAGRYGDALGWRHGTEHRDRRAQRGGATRRHSQNRGVDVLHLIQVGDSRNHVWASAPR